MPEKKSSFTNLKTFVFMGILCFTCALILSILAEALRQPQKNAKELYKSKQLLMAARILSYDGTFLLDNKPARFEKGQLILTNNPEKAKDSEILELFDIRVKARLTDAHGNLYTFEEQGLEKETYISQHAKLGYAKLPYKLIYIVNSNLPNDKPYGYVIPVNGYGLWDAIYGYLGVASNGDTVLGMTWYDQKETPGLGGEIALPEWQEQFYQKEIFKKNPDGFSNLERDPLGIKVVKSTVKEALGDSVAANSAVDGIAGASITVSGVNEALRSSLAPYRSFLIRVQKDEVKANG